VHAYDIAVFTHRGTVRARNEDAVFAGETVYQGNMRTVIAMRLTGVPRSVLVADGIGGQPEGDLASRTALQFLTAEDDLLSSPARCEAALHAANEHLYGMMDEPDRVGMGTTVVGLALQAAAVVAFNVGDSRAYRFGGSGLVKLSCDDVVSAMRGGHRSHEITQALGGCTFLGTITPHVAAGPPMQGGERFLLCSDGLTDVLDDGELERVLRLSPSSSAAVERLVRRAISAGSRDNISVVVGTCV
jgi:protein phosphatase